MRSVMTSRVRRADITQRIHKRTTANNNMAQRRLDAHNAALYGHYTSREICHSESSAGSYHWMNLIVMRQNTVDQLSCSKLSQTRGDKRVATIKDSVGVKNFLWRMLRLCSTLIYSALVFLLAACFLSKKVESGWKRAGLTLVSCFPVLHYEVRWWWRCSPTSLRGILIEQGNWTDNSLNSCWWHVFLLSSCLAGTALSALPLVLISMLFLCRGGAVHLRAYAFPAWRVMSIAPAGSSSNSIH